MDLPRASCLVGENSRLEAFLDTNWLSIFRENLSLVIKGLCLAEVGRRVGMGMGILWFRVDGVWVWRFWEWRWVWGW